MLTTVQLTLTPKIKCNDGVFIECGHNFFFVLLFADPERGGCCVFNKAVWTSPVQEGSHHDDLQGSQANALLKFRQDLFLLPPTFNIKNTL